MHLQSGAFRRLFARLQLALLDFGIPRATNHGFDRCLGGIDWRYAQNSDYFVLTLAAVGPGVCDGRFGMIVENENFNRTSPPELITQIYRYRD